MGTFGLMWISMSPIAGRADLPGWTDLPDSGVVRGWCGVHDSGPGQRSPLFRRERPLDTWTQLVEFYGIHGSAGAAAMALRRLGRP